MSRESDLATVVAQERALVFQRFDEEEAFRLGMALRERAVRDALPLFIDVSTWDRQLFAAALPGSAAANANWVRRKINAVRLHGKSTYRMVLEQARPDRTFAPDFGLDPADYALAGGSFPVRVTHAGIIGAVTVSGLPQRQDHGLVVEALCAHLGQDAGSLSLPPE